MPFGYVILSRGDARWRATQLALRTRDGVAGTPATCVEHAGHARRKATARWRERCLDPCPTTAEEAHDRIIKQSLGQIPNEALEEAPF